MKHLLTVVALSLPTVAFAVGDSSSPASPTETTTNCMDGKVWSDTKNACVAPQEGRLDDDLLYRAAREFAYAGRYDHALGALSAMSDPLDDRVLTYKGFIARMTGDANLGNAYYAQAIARNPGNLLARSYMGQGFAEAGDMAAARAQLTEIRSRRGRGSWAEISLRLAIENGSGSAY